MELDPPVPLSSLVGGSEQFLAEFHGSQVAAAIAQNRLQETPDAIAVAANPFLGILAVSSVML